VPEVVICGAGILGVSAAYFLARAGLRDILLVDERPPLTLTSDHSTECYRNWWPDAGMLALMSRSIDLMEQLADQSGNAFQMNRRGYLFVSGDEAAVPAMRARALRTAGLGAGPLREHSSAGSSYQPSPADGFHGQPEGADLLLGPELIRHHFPCLTGSAVAALHVRRAGWLSAQQLGMLLLDGARREGVQFMPGRIEAIDSSGGRVRAIRLEGGRTIPCGVFVNAAGPYLKDLGRLLGVDIPVSTELHLKAAFQDGLGVVGREVPLLIWEDPQHLPWSAEERRALADDPETRWLTEIFPAGVHLRPEGGRESRTVLMLWDYRTRAIDPVFPVPLDPHYPELALRGLAHMLPGLEGYFDRMPRPQLDGGYYTRTRENRLLAGPLAGAGTFVIGAASGYGIMSACGAGELLAAHISGRELPGYAAAFSPARYDDPQYLESLESWQEAGQL
jgi:glycine/D-amino acid oxidase-like deaminating enzyme